MPSFLDYIKGNAPGLFDSLEGEVDKDIGVGDVHVPAAGGDGGKKKKTKETLTRVVSPPSDDADKSLEDATFDEMGGDSRSFAYWMEKLKLKQKTTLDCDPTELRALLAQNPQLAAALAQILQNTSLGKAATTRTILLMRHGATHLNNQDTSVDRIRGWKNVPLSEEGKEEAAKLAEKIAKDPPDHIVSSDLKRAADTAKMVAAASDMKVDDISKGFRPWDVGDFAGKSSKEAVPVLCDYAINKPDTPVPGGEAFNKFRSRFFNALAGALKTYDGKVGVVTHHRGERLLKAWAEAGYPADGSMDGKTFTKKGEKTAGFESMDIPLDRLNKAASSKFTKFVGAEDLDLTKIWEGEEIEKKVETEKSFALQICKVDTDQQIFYGWAYVSEENGQIVIDKQDDYILPADLLKAAEDFTLHGGKLGDMHDARNVGRVVASFVTTDELCKSFGLSSENSRRGWILGFKVDDPEVWKKIKGGAQLELSIGGRGERIEWTDEHGNPHVRRG